MAKTRLFSGIVAAVALLAVAVAVVAEGQVGGRMEIEDVKSNREVQGLGRFSVEEYNRNGGERVKFRAVVGAERQVVSGTKYYLRILGMESGEEKIYESVVVVKPWMGSKRLLHFHPYTSSPL